ncbi:MAG: hypothetical protein KAW66_12540, partial [Candidatus Lokiarchaeota archaeon]|nr:hypothetical protein [Candidatus Lokiarchaeota archaeon]
MKSLSKFGEDFLLTALRINKHIKGYVDFYYGPEKLLQIVNDEAITSPKSLLIDSNNLLNKIDLQGYNKERERYLEKLLTAMLTSIEILNGSKISIKDQYLRIYDVDLQPANEFKLDTLKDEVDKAYSGPGSLEDRIAKLRVKRRVPESKALTLFKKALNIVRKQTEKLFTKLLPEEEHISIDVEKSKDEIKWSFYNWYLGNYHSQIVINPKYSMYWTLLLSAACHEGYPGHHTEFVLDEKNLYNEQNHFEHSILLLQSPKLVICEGIGDLAMNVLFSYQKSAEISLQELCPFSLKEECLEDLIAQNKVRGKLTLFWYNLAYHALFDDWDVEELTRYAHNFEIFSEESIKNQLKLMYNPAHSLTAFSYNLGSNLIINKYGEFPSVKNFRYLLVNP